MKNNGLFQAEYETKLNKVYLHLMVDKEYHEDYQMPMLRQNQIEGVLVAEGCFVEGKSRSTYAVGGLTSMAMMHEKAAMKEQTIRDVVSGLLAVTENLQEYLLSPNCILLEPEYIFYEEGQWYFCYFPEMELDLGKSFHQLTEYFVRTLDYGDAQGIFLAYELHKATLQEHYDLKQIMEDYEKHEMERKAAEDEATGRGQELGNVFCLTDEEEQDMEMADEYVKYRGVSMVEVLREENDWWGSLKMSAKKLRGRRWGNWDDLILESENPMERDWP